MRYNSNYKEPRNYKIGTKNMALSLRTAVNSIIARFHAENKREGTPDTHIEWTGNHQFRGRQLWIELKFTDMVYGTYITGWTNGVEEHGFLTFEED